MATKVQPFFSKRLIISPTRLRAIPSGCQEKTWFNELMCYLGNLISILDYTLTAMKVRSRVVPGTPSGAVEAMV
tara:strand:+ start:703 stop:924 length:222 start_codon:yes stop_codon:yes gene_type:complete